MTSSQDHVGVSGSCEADVGLVLLLLLVLEGLIFKLCPVYSDGSNVGFLDKAGSLVACACECTTGAQ
jgi:hypothetical protein